MQNPITKFTLSNGLTVALKEIHNAPIISHWVWYRIGSRDEYPGITGISHWVEHMLFKGTTRFPQGVLDQAISRVGGFWNALTFLDWTTFFETLPSDKIDLAMELEADRMINSKFIEKEVELERTVIISERQGNENDPLFQLAEKIQAAAFQTHAYHHEVIGDLADLKSIQRDDLYNHYRSYYVPNNAVIAIAGDFQPKILLEKLQKYYGDIPSGDTPPRRYHPEPLQADERRVAVEGPGETTYLQIAFHAPQANHPDFFPLMVLDSLLAGPSSLNMFSGGISNKTSRLYRAIIETDLAISLQSAFLATIDPFLHAITTVLHPNSNVDKVLDAIDEEVYRLQDTPPSENELIRAVKQSRALFAYGGERITNQAFWIGLSEMIDTDNWFESFLDKLTAVSPEDVQRVARTYLRQQNRVVGVYSPRNNKNHTLQKFNQG